MDGPKCDGETRKAAVIDSSRDEVIELDWSYCLDPECGWSDQEGHHYEDDRRELEAGLL